MSTRPSGSSSSVTGRGSNDDDDLQSDGDPASKRAKASAGGPFVCQTCSKSYSRIENLTRHAATHDAVSRFPCNTCGKRFTRSDLLNRHKKIHGLLHNSTPISAVHQDVNVSIRQKEYQPALQEPENLWQPHVVPPSIETQQQFPTTSHGSFTQAQAVLDQSQYAQPLGMPSWDGFMMYDNSNVFSMGSYDADIAWTFDFAQTDMPYDFSYQIMGTPSVGDMSEPGYSSTANSYHLPQPAPPDPVADGEEAPENDWPDNASRPSSPKPRQRRRLDATVWRSVEDEAQRHATQFSLYPHSFSGHIDYSVRGSQIIALGLVPANQTTDMELSDAVYPMPTVLEYYLRLYLHYVHDRFPVLHLPTFDAHRTSPLLLATMMMAGSSHSKADRGRFSRLFYKPIRVAVMQKVEDDASFLRSVENILTFMLLCVTGTWSGDKQAYEFAEGSRGILVTASRRCRLMDCRPNRITPLLKQNTTLEDVWLAWIESERKKRLGLAIYLFDCQYPSFFNNQPYISKAETTNCVFACAAEYWEAVNAESWKVLIGPADVPPSTFYLHALNCCLLRKYVKPAPPFARTDSFGKIVLIYALFTHIFEWRQSVSMLNPTSLMSAFSNSAHDLGDGLRGRRQWLLDSLDSFADCYHTPDTPIAASIMHQLAYVALNVSLSDLHLAAGRSSSKEDGEFAEQALKSWAHSDNAKGTMEHVEIMLGIAHQSLENGIAATASFEVAVCLFQGGLVCWVYDKLRDRNTMERDGRYDDHVRDASRALKSMGCWRMCAMFGGILKAFEAKRRRAESSSMMR